MKIEYENQTKLAFFQELYNEARSSADKMYEKLDQNIKQYKGDANIDGSDTPAEQVRNVTYELIESQVTSYIPNPSVNVKMYSEKNERNAKSIETLLKNKRDELPFEKLNDIDERFNPIYGGSVWLVEWDNSIRTHNTVGDVKLSCINPNDFTGQPNIYDIAEMEYCFVQFETTKDDIVRKYGVRPTVADETESDENADDKTATLYVCYYKNENDKVCQYIWSGDTEISDIEDYYARKIYVCKNCGKRKEICNCDKPKYELQNDEYEEVDRDINLSDGGVISAQCEIIEDGQVVMETKQQQAINEDGSVALENINGVVLPKMVEIQVPKMEQTKLPYYTPNLLPVVIRKNISQEKSLLGQSDCEAIRPQQQGINKIESRIIQKCLGSGVFPIVPENFNGELDNSLFKKVFRANQANAKLYGRIDLQVDISRDIAEAERLYDQAKRILGITDSYQGQYDSSAQSGKAKQIQVQQAAGRLDSKRQMKNAAYAEIDHIIFQYYLAYADEPRPAAYKDAQGKTQNCMFNRYDFLERDDAGEWYYNDEYLFSADASIDVDKQRETLWQENRQNFQAGAYGNPQDLETLLIFWQNMERTHYPFAHDNVERIKMAIEKQQLLQQMQAQLDSQNEELKTRREYEEYLKSQINGGMSNGKV